MSSSTTMASACPSAAAGSFQRCLCEYAKPADDARLPWDFSVLCSYCCKRSLRPHIERNERALLERDLAKERCAQRLEKSRGSSKSFSELRHESERLRQRRADLQKRCAAVAVEIAEHAYQNEERRESLHNPQAEWQRLHLQRLDRSVCEGSLKQAIANAREHVRILRFQWALKAFAMHRLDVRPEDCCNRPDEGDEESANQRRRSSTTGRPKQARGIGKIGGLPLPHAGPELYGVLPPEQLQSALRLVASISSTVARCLGILLPHPVLLQRTTSHHQQGDIIHSALMTARPAQKTTTNNHSMQQQDPTSTESLLALLNATLDDTDGTPPGTRNNNAAGLEERANSTVIPPSMDPALVSQRLRHATAAILAEASSNTASQYKLSADIMHQDEFAIALQFLQNNVIALCIRAGVPVAKLWPAEAVLLNLFALQVFCEDQVKQCLKQ